MSEPERAQIEKLELLMEKFKQEGFTPQVKGNSIHSSESIRFYKTYMDIEEWTIDVLVNGLNIPLTGRTGKYEEDNNQSAIRNIVVLREKITKWEQEGKLHQVMKKPKIVSPMSVVEKIDIETGRCKFRPVIDHSRYVNLFIEDKTCKLNDLNYFDPLLDSNMYMTCFDLADMYHHVRLNSRTSDLFGFKIPQEDGSYKYFQFNVLMFGSKPATWITAKLLKPAVNYFRAHGIKCGIFVDDGAMLNTCP